MSGARLAEIATPVLAPAEAPDRVADLIMQHAGDPPESNDRSTDRKN
jgi:hypothetical protein